MIKKPVRHKRLSWTNWLASKTEHVLQEIDKLDSSINVPTLPETPLDIDFLQYVPVSSTTEVPVSSIAQDKLFATKATFVRNFAIQLTCRLLKFTTSCLGEMQGRSGLHIILYLKQGLIKFSDPAKWGQFWMLSIRKYSNFTSQRK